MRGAWQLVRIGALITLLGSAAAAEDPDRAPCPLDQAIKSIENQSLELNLRIAREKLPLLRRIERLDEKDFLARPSGRSLTSAERLELQGLRFQIVQLDAYRIPINDYLHGAKVISKLREVADASSQGDLYEDEPDRFYFTILTSLRRVSPQDGLPTSPASPSECTVETGLHFYEQTMLQQIAEMNGFDPAMKRLTVIARKHKLDMAQDGWVERVPSEKNRKIARVDSETVTRGLAMRQYVSDLENLKRLNQIMLLQYESDMDDVKQAQNEEQLSKRGTSFSGKIKRLDHRGQAVANVRNMIMEKIAREDQQWQGSSK
ncbi:MAG TPA: hypothetical protein VGU20_25290 [Stellaceae bacterium]|nr:hypothetical protein [Stellaceae bacterium]